MSSLARTFSKTEYEVRIAAVRREMAERDVELLLVYTPENILYLTGYQTAGYFGYQCLALPAEGEAAIITRRQEEQNARLMSWVQRRFSVLDGDDKVARTVEMLREYPGSKRIGIEKNSWFLTVAVYERLAELLRPAQLVDCSQLVDRVRLIKSDQEIEYLREAARILDAGMIKVMEAIREGITENDIAATFSDATIRAGGEYTGIPHLVKSGERCSLAHATWDSRRLRGGDVVFMELSACVKRYSAAMMRTVQVRPEDAEVSRAAGVVIESLNRVLEVLRPGMRTGDLYDTAVSVIQRAGFPAAPRRMGYSLGLGFPPRWGEWDTFDFQPGGKLEIKSGMILHVVPTIPLRPDAAIGFSETVLVTENGNEALTTAARSLRIV